MLPDCIPCGDCFDNWDRVIRNLKGGSLDGLFSSVTGSHIVHLGLVKLRSEAKYSIGFKLSSQF